MSASICLFSFIKVYLNYRDGFNIICETLNAKVAGILGELLAISPFDLKKVYEIWVFQDVHNTYARVHMVLEIGRAHV